MARPKLLNATQLIEYMATAQLPKVEKLSKSRHIETALMATRLELPNAQIDNVLLETNMPNRIYKGVDRAAQKARFK